MKAFLSGLRDFQVREDEQKVLGACSRLHSDMPASEDGTYPGMQDDIDLVERLAQHHQLKIDQQQHTDHVTRKCDALLQTLSQRKFLFIEPDLVAEFRKYRLEKELADERKRTEKERASRWVLRKFFPMILEDARAARSQGMNVPQVVETVVAPALGQVVDFQKQIAGETREAQDEEEFIKNAWKQFLQKPSVQSMQFATGQVITEQQQQQQAQQDVWFPLYQMIEDSIGACTRRVDKADRSNTGWLGSFSKRKLLKLKQKLEAMRYDLLNRSHESVARLRRVTYPVRVPLEHVDLVRMLIQSDACLGDLYKDPSGHKALAAAGLDTQYDSIPQWNEEEDYESQDSDEPEFNLLDLMNEDS